MKTRTRVPSMIAMAVGLALGLSGAAGAVDLIETYKLALDNDPEFAAAVSGNKAAQEFKPQARAGLLPNVALQASTAWNDGRRKARGRSGAMISDDAKFNTNSYGISLTQPVFRWDRWVQLEQADNRVKQANAELDAAAQDLIVRSAQRYFEVLAAEDNLEFRITTREAFNSQYNQALQRFEVGLIAITDVEEAKAGHDLAVAEEIRARNALENAREALRELVGEYYEQLAPLGGEVPLTPPDPNSPEQWVEKALAENRQVAAATFAAKVAQEEISRRFSGHLPTLDLVAARDYNAQSESYRLTDLSIGGPSRNYVDSIGLQLTLPIFSGGLTYSQTEQARYQYQQSLDQLESARRGTYRQARQSFNGILDSISGVAALRQAEISTRKALEATEAGFQVGTRTSVDVLNAQQRTYESQRDYKNAQYTYILGTLRLKQAAGTLSPDDLVPINSWLKH